MLTGSVAGGQGGRLLLVFVAALGVCGCTLPLASHAADIPARCKLTARMISIQGAVQVRRAGESGWSYVRRLDTPLCEGDLVHTGPTGRVALLVSPETLLRLQQNSTVSIRQTSDETIVEYTISEFREVLPTAPNPCGAGYFITRFPRRFRVLTPFINASVEGTEFLVALSCQSATVAVFEGRVLARQILIPDSTAFSLQEGQQITAGGPEPPAVKLLVKPVDAVQWALYYPPLTQPAGEEAADQPCNQADAVERGQCILQRAEQRLRTGRVVEAEVDLEILSTIAPNSGDPYALRSIIQLSKNEKAEAMALAKRATELSPPSSGAWLALSYAHQAAFELEKALEAARKSTELEPNSSTAQARVAELLMSLGRIRDAEKAARAAVAANPNDSRAHAVLGFVHLAQINTKAAREDFLAAIERDSSDPLPRLGLGLAIIRDGDLKAGREQIEIAIILDPTNSLVRSYMGKAYYEENTKERDQLAAKQFVIAKELDPRDPTPWFYDALLKQTQNRPVEALADLQTSIELNDNRAVYRSTLLLDSDQAARDVSQAEVYRRLGFADLAFPTTHAALSRDPKNFSAHRMLADLFADKPRHELARVSEALQAQVWQPAAARPFEPSILDEEPLVLLGTGPESAVANEFSSLFVQNGTRGELTALLGTQQTRGDQLLLSHLKDNWSFSLGQFHYESDGFRESAEVDKDLYTVNGQVDISNHTSLLAEFRHNDSLQEDLAYRFDPELFFPQKVRARSNSLRFTVTHRPDVRSGIVGSLVFQETEDETDLSDVNLFQQDTKNAQAELQYVHSFRNVRLVFGASYLSGDIEVVASGSESTDETLSTNIYAYSYIDLFSGRLSLQAGVSRQREEGAGLPTEINQTNPKLGLTWSIAPSTTIRAAVFRMGRRRLVAEQTLEPTQVAGFNQLFDDLGGTDSRRACGAIEHRFSPTVWIDAEACERKLDIPSQFGIAGNFTWKEKEAYVRAYWTPTAWSAISVRYERTKFERTPDFPGIEFFVSADTTLVPFEARVFRGSFALGLRQTYVKQHGDFFDVNGVVFPGSDSFWTTDLSLNYFLPRRLGSLGLEVRNLFDQDFRFQETNFATPTLARDRLILGRVSLVF